MLEDVSKTILKLSKRENLTAEETRRAFNIIGDNDEESYYYIAITLGLMAKGPTAEELYGVCLDRRDRVPKFKIDIDPDLITDISGGGGGISTFNVSTAASLIIASGGVYVAKQAAPAVTSPTGSYDLLNEIGIDVPLTNGDAEKVKESLKRTRYAAYYYSAFSSERFKNFLTWRSNIKRIGLKYLTPWHLMSFVYSLFDMKTRVYGLFSDKYLRALAELFQKFDYNRGIILHGTDGLDELSNVGPTKICEFDKKEIKEYTVTPEELGVKKAEINDITAKSREGNIIDFLRVIYGGDTGPRRDLAAINAGASFYVTGQSKTLKDGTNMAIDLLDNRKVAEKLEELVAFYGNYEKLNQWKNKL